MKRITALLLAVLMLLTLLAGCGANEATTPDSGTGTGEDTSTDDKKDENTDTNTDEEKGEGYLRISVGLNDTLSALKPINVAGYTFVSQLIFGNLMRYDMDAGEYIPALAEKLDISDDGLVYTVTLGDNYFHDGEPITADDVVFTYTNAITGAGGRCSKLSSIVGYQEAYNGETDTVEGIQKVDDKTVTFTLSQRNSLFVEALANGCFGIIPEHILGGMTRAEIDEYAEYWEAPIGSGAYYVSETNYPNYIVLTAFEDYYDPSGIKNVLCTYYADQEAIYTAAIAGELDYLPGEEEAAANNVTSQNSDLEMVVAESTYRRWFMVNCSDTAGDQATHPSLKNAKVRQALNMLLDKDAMCQLMGSLAVPLTSQINPNLEEYNTDLPTFERDVEGAKKILDEEGFDYDTPIRIFANYTDQQTVDFLELVVQNLADGGVTAEYTIDGNWQPYLSVQDYDFRLAGGMSNDVINFYADLCTYGLSDYTKGNFFYDDPDWIAYQTERYNDLVDAFKASLDPVEKKEIIDQLQFNEMEDMYYIPLYALNNINIYNTAHWSGIAVYPRDYEEIADFNFSNWTLLG